ncbi:MAG: acyltransferase [Hyphomicrobiales bacterium]|nr:acyltransferase [Hyphomicrobiales bacterium]
MVQKFRPNRNSKSVYRSEIDGLRALAVVAVIVNHFEGTILPSGYLGVDIFFVISGFVITSSLADRRDNNLGQFLSLFYSRRIKRLVPALIFFIVPTGVLICLFDPSPGVSLKTGLTSLFGLSNVYLLRIAVDYFAASTDLNVFAHTWSLGIEEQFYFLFPFLLWFSGFGQHAPNGARNLLWVMVSLTCFSLVGFVCLYQINQPAAYFLMPNRLWELGAGCLLFVSLKHSPSVIRISEHIPSVLVTTGLIGVLFIPQSFPVLATIAAVCLTMVLIACLRSGTTTYAFFTHEKVVFVGRISYSLYLWHWGVLALSRWTIGIHWWSVPLLVALMFILAVISYRYVETPMRRSTWSLNNALTLGYGFVALVGASAILFVLYHPLNGRIYLGHFLNIPVPLNLQRTWWVDKTTGEYLERCHVKGEFTSTMLTECLGVVPGREGTVYLIGDSHARNYLPTVIKGFKNRSVTYLTMGGGCSFLPLVMTSKFERVRCSSYVLETTEFLLDKVQHGDVVVIGQSLLKYGKSRQTPVYVNHIKSFAQRLTKKQVPVVLLDGTFPPTLPPEQCLRMPWQPFSGDRAGCFVDSKDATKGYARFDSLADDASSQLSNLYYIPLRMGLCHEGRCGQTTASGLSIWHDRGHITEEVARELTPLFLEKLKKQGFFQRFGAE